MSNTTLTLEQLKALKPCAEGFTWYAKNIKTTDLNTILPQLANQNWGWCRWLFVRLLNDRQNRELAIYCAELVLSIFEAKYPDDKRPREAIEAAKAYSRGEISREGLRVKRIDAAYAAYADAAAAAAATAAADAAYAADAAADAAVYAADAAYYAAYAADFSAIATKAEEIKTQIINKVLDLLSTKGEVTNEQ